MAKNRLKRGVVYLVGAGPGDPGLFTVRGVKLLQRADAIVFDRLVNPSLLDYAPLHAEKIYAGKLPDRHTLTQDEINSLLVKLAVKGKTVVRLKGGDPLLFGRGAEEALFMAKHGIRFEIVPGVTSALAVPAYAGIPPTFRNYTSSLGIFTGHEDPGKESSAIAWDKIATGLGTLIFLMGVENLNSIVNKLISHGRHKSTPCCVIRWGTTFHQQTVSATLQTIADKSARAGITSPAVLIVGEVVKLREQIKWFETRPLFGKKFLITSPVEDARRLTGPLTEAGAECIEMPMIKISGLQNKSTLISSLESLDRFAWVIFTSQNGVRFFQQALVGIKKDIRILAGIKIAAIGPKTAEALEALGVKVDVRPRKFCQEGLIEEFKKYAVRGKSILMIRAAEARDVLPEGLKKMGAFVSVVPAYKTVPVDYGKKEKSLIEDCDMVTFTSSSCVESFQNNFPSHAEVCAASLGPVTSATAKKYGLRVAVEAREYVLESLIEGITKYYTNKAGCKPERRTPA